MSSWLCACLKWTNCHLMACQSRRPQNSSEELLHAVCTLLPRHDGLVLIALVVRWVKDMFKELMWTCFETPRPRLHECANVYEGPWAERDHHSEIDIIRAFELRCIKIPKRRGCDSTSCLQPRCGSSYNPSCGQWISSAMIWLPMSDGSVSQS